MTLVFKNLTADELHEAIAPLGGSLSLARRLQAVVMRRDKFPEMLPEVSPSILERIRMSAHFPRLTVEEKVVSPDDGFAKYLFRSEESPESFEAVRIPLLHRAGEEKYIVCVSSQVGCGMGCTFCATGKQGLIRNLSTWEMVDQVIRIQADSVHPVRGVVFMGMGEPLLNYDAVVRAARILSEPCGMAIAAKSISVSTVGVVPGIRRFTEDRLPFRLIVSLTSADPERRRKLIPAEEIYPLADVMAALREFHAASRQRVTLAWTMISGFNTREADAIQLAELTRGLPITLDLIDVNDTTGRFQPPSTEERNRFRDDLRRHLQMPVVRRYSGGQDIQAACGMLAGRKTPCRKPKHERPLL